jgi:hypothetical protein
MQKPCSQFICDIPLKFDKTMSTPIPDQNLKPVLKSRAIEARHQEQISTHPYTTEINLSAPYPHCSLECLRKDIYRPLSE